MKIKKCCANCLSLSQHNKCTAPELQNVEDKELLYHRYPEESSCELFVPAICFGIRNIERYNKVVVEFKGYTAYIKTEEECGYLDLEVSAEATEFIPILMTHLDRVNNFFQTTDYILKFLKENNIKYNSIEFIEVERTQNIKCKFEGN